MALSNYERVGKSMEALKIGLAPFVSREFINHYKGQARQELERITEVPSGENKPFGQMDVAALLKVMWDSWNEVYRETLGHAERSLVSELRDVRNRWAHQSTFSSDDTYRALDSTHRLLTSVSSPQANEIDKLKMELLRVRFDEQTRTEGRKTPHSLIDSPGTANLKPWREVVTPHGDVSSGRYQQAEFAADLWQVYLGEGSDEYRDPVEFFRRTYLTQSLRSLLISGVQRVSGKGGSPVWQLQTNFGGGKTHSMLALYHLFSGTPPNDLSGIDNLLSEAEIQTIPKVNRVVLAGHKISPGLPDTKHDGTEVRTLWGELAWQLGGKEAFERIRPTDENPSNPADELRKLMNDYGPCLILIDEWVAYARQLHEGDDSELPGGSFETQFSFAQALSESAKAAKNCLLVISLPESVSSASPHLEGEAIEVGGQRGRKALTALKLVIGRTDQPWSAASSDERYEIVRRRLFEPMTERNQFVARDTVTKAFSEFYQTQHQEFPPECREAEYEKRMTASYPIHPEVFARLSEDWSSLEHFQRTRGVLRLMAAVIHNLWENGDPNPLILPANIPIDNSAVHLELKRYLPESWGAVIEKDVDGPTALPLAIDRRTPHLGRFSATRRVARTLFLGSAPTTQAANLGLEERRVKLGSSMPGESPSILADALRRLTSEATYLYQDGTRFWYSDQPSVNKLVQDRAEILTRSPDKVAEEIDKRLRLDVRQRGDFSRVHALPHSGQDVPDATDSGLVVLGLDHPYSREANSPGEVAAKQILESRGNSPRMYRNTLVFLAVDKTRLQDLDEATRNYLAWESIINEKDSLNLTLNDVRNAETKKLAADSTVTARIPEAYQWLLVPTQSSHDALVEFQAIQLRTPDALAVRASKRLRSDELLVTRYGSTLLRKALDKARGNQDHALWRGRNHVSVRQLVEDFASYLYLQRLRDSSVLTQAVQDGVALMTWELDSFAYAESYDEESDRYRGLRHMQQVSIADSDPGLIVKPEVARKQIDAETPVVHTPVAIEDQSPTLEPGPFAPTDQPAPTVPDSPKARRYHGSVKLDPTRAGRDASVIADEVIAHLVGLMGSKIKVTLEIEAEIPDGAPEQVVRTVTENSRTLKFDESGFEIE